MEREISQEEQEEEVAEEGEKVEGEEEVKEGEEDEKGEGEGRLETQEPKEEEMTIIKPKMKEFPGSSAVVGLRIRAEPSFLVSSAHNLQVNL